MPEVFAIGLVLTLVLYLILGPRAAAVGLLAYALLMVATGCGPEAPTSGYIRDKRYTPAYTEHWTSLDCTWRDSKTGQCIAYMTNDHYDYHPERFEFDLENCDATDDKGKPKCSRGWRGVPEFDYTTHPIGTHYPDPR